MFDGWPYWALFVVFFLGAFVRGNTTYWIGRGLRHGTRRTRLGRRFEASAVARAEHVIERVGAPVVSLSFLTVGVQTLINASAGVLRMPLRWYLPAVTVGALLWSAVYTTIGMALWRAWVGGVLADWWLVLVLLAVIGLATLAGRSWLRRVSPAPRTTPTGPEPDDTQPSSQ